MRSDSGSSQGKTSGLDVDLDAIDAMESDEVLRDEAVAPESDEVPPPDPGLDASVDYRRSLLARPLTIGPSGESEADLTRAEWAWLRAYRTAERRSWPRR